MPVSIVGGGGEWNWVNEDERVGGKTEGKGQMREVRIDKERSNELRKSNPDPFRDSLRSSQDWRVKGDSGLVYGLNAKGGVETKNIKKGVKMTRQIPTSILGFSSLGGIVSVRQTPPNGEGEDEGRLMGGGKGGGWVMKEVEVRGSDERSNGWSKVMVKAKYCLST